MCPLGLSVNLYAAAAYSVSWTSATGVWLRVSNSPVLSATSWVELPKKLNWTTPPSDDDVVDGLNPPSSTLTYFTAGSAVTVAPCEDGSELPWSDVADAVFVTVPAWTGVTFTVALTELLADTVPREQLIDVVPEQL